MEFGELYTKVVATSTLAGNLFLLGLIILFFIRRSIVERALALIGRRAMLLGFLLAFLSTAGSLVYSEVMHFTPCVLCWIARLLMYPLVLVFGYGLFREGKHVYILSLVISLSGIGVTTYHWIKNMLATYVATNIPCPAIGTLPTCNTVEVFEYHYITIPMIALNAFLLIALTAFAGLRAYFRPEK